MNEATSIVGHIVWQLHAADGSLIREGSVKNLVTAVGDQMYAERGAGISGAPAAPTGMKLGTGSGAPAKTSTGSALVTYLTNSHQGFDSTYPSSALNGSSRRVTYRATFGAGKATTASAITEVVIVNESLTDATSASAATIARGLITGVGSKGSGETLTITWTHDILGA
ncbi:MAG TPA: hypothetical protein VNA32_10190 [Actinomycetota bacterium]|nr:hypothetical protein [Actinomycetota bacterium]